jgi:hypothetical protein
MALRQRDAAGEGKEETAELYGDGDGAEAGQPAHVRGPVPKWSEQLTARGLVVAATVGIMYSVIVMKLNLTTGLNPTLNVSAALISFVMLRGWTQALARLGVAVRPLTRQENTVVQTCAVACYSIGSAGQRHQSLLTLIVRLAADTLDVDAYVLEFFVAPPPQVGSGPTCLGSTRRPTRWRARTWRATWAPKNPALGG